MLLPTSSSQVPVEPVGHRREREDRSADQLLRHPEDTTALEFGQQHDN